MLDEQTVEDLFVHKHLGHRSVELLNKEYTRAWDIVQQKFRTFQDPD